MNNRRTASALITVLLIVGMLVPAFPQRAHAQQIVNDPINLVQNTISAIRTHWLFIKESSLDGIAWKVGREVIASISKSTVKWINSGFNGSPAYVTDLERTLLRVSDKVANDFFRELSTNSAIDSPFRTVVAGSLRDQYYRSTGRNAYFNQNRFTLGQFSQNPAALLKGDLSQGGLTAFREAFRNPQNNPVMAREAAQNALGGIVASSQGTRLTELSWGRGLESFRGNDCAGDPGSIAGSSGSSAPTSGHTSLSDVDNCVGKQIRTPGAAINASLEKVVGIELDQLGLADEFNEVLAALMSQLMTNMLGGGGLFGLSQPSSGGGASYADQLRGSDNTSTGGSTAFLETIANQKQAMATYVANWMVIKEAAQGAVNACTNDGSAPSVITQADAAIAKADATVSALIEIEVKLEAAAQATGIEQTTLLNEAAQMYNAVVSMAPTASEIATAQAQSQNTSGTLYMQMKELAESCGG